MPSTSSRYGLETRRAGRHDSLALRGLVVVAKALASFAVTFAELLAELLAPLLLFTGALWWGALRLVGQISVEPELQAMLHVLPTHLQLGGHELTPAGLIRQGLLLLAVVAACRTVNRLLAREL
ncbi:hypothetical protein CR162_16005 [Pseudoroseomonas rhizosphaerae]|uniref:Uncharacterized protein n=1 Tax=Teichococcus rhizosphaerae TaxID=1335062 RepID=A0A2C7AA39_9PROT|nr:hypothetical protein [Pseudoroseomonas rhizosphaerae]PHK93924.1 hypothetical protein CR162_16005 [Pseudoroseomonas rhizosphaerae]